MDTNHRPDDARRRNDPLDRLIDEAVESHLRARPVDLRAQVLEAIDRGSGGADGRATSAIDRGSEDPGYSGGDAPRRLWLRPAFLPVAGALLMMAGVGILWQHANERLGDRVAQTRPTSAASVPAPAAAGGSTVAGAPNPTPPAAARVEAPHRAERLDRPTRAPKAFAWLESDDDRKVVGTVAMLAEGDSDVADTEETTLPGAPAGDLGDPVAPMPKLKPIDIRPIATPPMTMAPPVSTLAKPVSSLTDEATRDRQDPGKPGGKQQ